MKKKNCGCLKETETKALECCVGEQRKMHLLAKAKLFKPSRLALRKRKKRKDEKAGRIFLFSFHP